jgi:hypothetical protein
LAQLIFGPGGTITTDLTQRQAFLPTTVRLCARWSF